MHLAKARRRARRPYTVPVVEGALYTGMSRMGPSNEQMGRVALTKWLASSYRSIRIGRPRRSHIESAAWMPVQSADGVPANRSERWCRAVLVCVCGHTALPKDINCGGRSLTCMSGSATVVRASFDTAPATIGSGQWRTAHAACAIAQQKGVPAVGVVAGS